MPLDAVKMKLYCAGLVQWRYERRREEEGVGNGYALCLLDSVHVVVHLACPDEKVECVSMANAYKGSITRTVGTDDRNTLEDEVYYVNRSLNSHESEFEVEPDGEYD